MMGNWNFKFFYNKEFCRVIVLRSLFFYLKFKDNNGYVFIELVFIGRFLWVVDKFFNGWVLFFVGFDSFYLYENEEKIR